MQRLETLQVAAFRGTIKNILCMDPFPLPVKNVIPVVPTMFLAIETEKLKFPAISTPHHS
jgi:hypothetical protein